MMDIKGSRFNSIRFRKLFGDRGEASQAGPESHRLLFRRSSAEDYCFENGRILLNGVDIAHFIDGPEADIALWAGLAGAVDEYRKTVWSRYGTDWRDFNGQSQALLEKLLGKLAHAYEEMTGGIRIQWNGSRLWINDIDPKVVLALFLSNPSEERRRYLESIRNKLTLILSGKVGKAHSHGILEEAKRIYHQIHTALENAAAACSPRLLAVVPNWDR